MELPRPSARRIYFLPPAAAGGLAQTPGHLDRVRALGFDTVLIAPVFQPGPGGDLYLTADPGKAQAVLGGGQAEQVVGELAAQAQSAGLDLFMDLVLDRFALDHPLVQAHPQAFTVRRGGAVEGAVDPRRPAPLAGEAQARLWEPACAKPVAGYAADQILRWASAGLKGVRLLRPDMASPELWEGLIGRVREAARGFTFIAETEGVARPAVLALGGCGFEALTSSLPYWDGRARWFVEEYEALRQVAPLIAVVEPPFGARIARRGEPAERAGAAIEQRLRLAAATGAGLLMPMGVEAGSDTPLFPRDDDAVALDTPPNGLVDAVRAATALSGELSRFGGELRMLTGEGAAVTALLRANAADVRRSTAALLVLLNPDLDSAAEPQARDLLSAAGAEFEAFARVDSAEAPFAVLKPGEVRLLLARRSQPIVQATDPGPTRVTGAATAPRLVIEGVSPRVEGGAYPARRVVGETLSVEADVFTDGHEQLAVELQWRALDQAEWTRAPMCELGNDRWEASFPLDRLGRYELVVEGWLDAYAGFRRDYRKKRDAGVAQAVDARG